MQQQMGDVSYKEASRSTSFLLFKRPPLTVEARRQVDCKGGADCKSITGLLKMPEFISKSGRSVK